MPRRANPRRRHVSQLSADLPEWCALPDGAVCHDCVGHVPLPGVRHGCYRSSSLATVPLALTTLVHRKTWRTLPSAYVFLSRAERDLFAPLDLPANRVFVKPNLVPVMSSVSVAGEHKVAYVGRLSDTKGLPTLMASWDRYTRDTDEPRLRLVIAGAGPLEAAIRQWAQKQPAVEIAGLLDRAACARLVASARAVIVPSEWEETFGLVVVEAMASGVPTIAAARGSLPELVTDGVDGVVFAPGDVAALARVLKQVDEEPALFEKLGHRARRTYEERFDPEANLEELISIYRFAIEKPNLAGRRRLVALAIVRSHTWRPTRSAVRMRTPAKASGPPRSHGRGAHEPAKGAESTRKPRAFRGLEVCVQKGGHKVQRMSGGCLHDDSARFGVRSQRTVVFARGQGAYSYMWRRGAWRGLRSSSKNQRHCSGPAPPASMCRCRASFPDRITN